MAQSKKLIIKHLAALPTKTCKVGACFFIRRITDVVIGQLMAVLEHLTGIHYQLPGRKYAGLGLDLSLHLVNNIAEHHVR